MKILIIDDDQIIRFLISELLDDESYKLYFAEDGKEGLDLCKEERPDLIILDVSLPSIEGFSILKIIRNYPMLYGDPFIIMLTSKSNIDHIVKGLESGADDYIPKPFNHREFTARVGAIFRRKERSSGKVFMYKEIIVNIKNNLVKYGENREELILFKREFDLLVYFIKNCGIILPREVIYQEAWEKKYKQGERGLDVYIGKLKEKFPVLKNNLISIRGIGYKLLR